MAGAGCLGGFAGCMCKIPRRGRTEDSAACSVSFALSLTFFLAEKLEVGSGNPFVLASMTVAKVSSLDMVNCVATRNSWPLSDQNLSLAALELGISKLNWIKLTK